MVSVVSNGHRFLVANTHLESPAGVQHKKEHAELRELQLKQVKGEGSVFCMFWAACCNASEASSISLSSPQAAASRSGQPLTVSHALQSLLYFNKRPEPNIIFVGDFNWIEPEFNCSMQQVPGWQEGCW